MLKNKEFRYMIFAAAIFTVAASVCGYVLCGIAAFILLVILGIALGSGFIFFTKRRYNDIDKLNSYLVRVLEGDETVGLESGGFKKMLWLETLLYGMKALILGIPISLLLSYLMYRTFDSNLHIFDPDLIMYGIVMASVFGILGICMALSVNKIKNDNIIEVLKEDAV